MLAMALGDAASSGRRLNSLRMDGNPIGRAGARSLFRAAAGASQPADKKAVVEDFEGPAPGGAASVSLVQRPVYGFRDGPTGRVVGSLSGVASGNAEGGKVSSPRLLGPVDSMLARH
jgi:hypothetical protein